ncbi:MAG: flagellar hook-associated family protein [Rhizobiaceae bacterium]|nr:flagellar hook-associated family protein [Rhizobiaceae bacterium]
MKTSFVSNLAVQSSMRSTINQVQAELVQAQKEVVSGQRYNIGEELGGTTTRALDLRRERDMMDNLMVTNSVVTQRLSSSQMALETISNAGQTALNTFVALAGSTDTTQLTTAVRTITDVLDQVIDSANTSVNGEYVFAGINTDVRPMGDYLTDETGARSAFDTAFQTYFTFPKDDAQVQSITPAQMKDFIDTVLEPMFLTGADWTTTWSTASDTPMTSRISRTEVVQSSATANAEGFRQMALGAVIGIELLNLPFGSDTRAVVSDSAIDYMGKAIYGIDSERGQLGLSQNRVKMADEVLKAQVDIVKLNLDDLEGVDVYEASTRITALSNQMEISYNLTARISQLSLVNYI